EIARRLAKLADAPFLKVEATKFTEVGYVGRDVESIIRDLADMAVKMLREQEMKRHEHRALDAAEDRILDALLPPPRDFNEDSQRTNADSSTRQLFRKKLRKNPWGAARSEEHTSELQSRENLVCRLLL